jgi:glutamyl-tRNA reductase
LREKFQDIARAELARQRKRLGPLTTEQEAAVESLLMSTVNKLSHPILNQMRRFYGTSDADAAPGPNELFDPEE